MIKLISYLLHYSPKLVLAAGLTSILTGVSNTVLIAVVHKASLQYQNPTTALILGFLGACLLYPLSRIIGIVLITRLVQSAVYDIRMQLSRQIIRAPLRSLEQHGANKLTATLTDDVNTITSALAQLPIMCTNLTLFICCTAYLFWLHWIAGLLIFAAAVVGLGLFNAVAANASRYLRRSREERDTLFQHFRAITDGAKEFRLHRERRHAFLNQMLRDTGQNMRDYAVQAQTRMAFASSIGQILFFVAIGCAIFVLPLVAGRVSPEVVSGYTIILLYMVLPLDGLTSLAPAFKSAVIALKKIDSLEINLEADTREKEPDTTFPVKWNSLEYRRITHGYHHEREDRLFTMGPLDMIFKPGELVMIIGGNGSGKTTLAKLLTGLYAPESGEILLDGGSVTDQNRDAFRQLFTAVFADFYLFENLAGIPIHGREAAVHDYLKNLQLDHKVQLKDGALTTVQLSTGQRKRLALLTAWLEDRPIYLFDEWASDQDPVFKQIFYEVMLPELTARGKTVIAVSHDDHYFHVADRVIKLDYGQIEYDRLTPRV